MDSNRALLFAGVFALLAAPSTLRAQRVPARAGTSVPRVAPAPTSRPIAVRPAPVSQPFATLPMRSIPRTGIRVNTAGNFNATNGGANAFSPHPQDQENLGFVGGAPVSLEQLLNITPANGFNWQHVNAINQDLAQKALIDPVTQLEIAQAERLLRSGAGAFSGAYILGGGYGYYVPEQMTEEQVYPQPGQAQGTAQSAGGAEPRVIVLQQAPAAKANAEKTSAQPEETAPIIPGADEFTLVLRDGQHIKAVAFSHVGKEIVYITPDGARKTIDAGNLDAAATVQLNQEKGTLLQLPL